MGFTTRAHSSWGFRSRWILLAAVVLAAGAWRFHNLSNIFLLVDETDFFSQKLFLHPPRPLLEYALETRDATTNTWSWPAILWTACRLFCGTTKVARTPGALAGTGMVLAMFFLVYTLLPKDYPGNRFVPAIGAAIFTTIAMPQMEFSQRIYPSATAPLMGAILLLADLYVYRSLADKNGGIHQLLRSIGWYAFRRWPGCMYSSQLERVGGVINGVPGNRVVRRCRSIGAPDRNRLLAWSVAAASVVCLFVILNRKNPKFEFRPYLHEYYHEISFKSIPKLLLHVYNLATYHLNLFYNTKLYWPS